MKKAELVAIAKQNGLKGYSKLKKAELIELLRQHNLL
ncbi:MAG: Rho termination factor N-terminal domain-containing protein [Cyanobacteria bacterium P01_F01_bin.150]